jgi:hypothetical protein
VEKPSDDINSRLFLVNKEGLIESAEVFFGNSMQKRSFKEKEQPRLKNHTGSIARPSSCSFLQICQVLVVTAGHTVSLQFSQIFCCLFTFLSFEYFQVY